MKDVRIGLVNFRSSLFHKSFRGARTVKLINDLYVSQKAVDFDLCSRSFERVSIYLIISVHSTAKDNVTSVRNTIH